MEKELLFLIVTKKVETEIAKALLNEGAFLN
jgi:hypothetical protein